MAEKTVLVVQPHQKPIKILQWKVQKTNIIPIGRLLLLYDFEGVDKSEPRKLKASQAGQVHQILVQEGAVVKPGEAILELVACSHPTIMIDMCAECGADLRKDDMLATASVPMIHAIPDLKVSEELAQKLGKADNERLIKDRKLVLLVDLDQTLIHTTNDNIPANIKDVYHFQLYGPNSPWYHTRLRPRTHEFLTKIYDYFELHICTFGARNYAHRIAMFLDEDQKFFSSRILSRDECFDPTSKKANLKALFPCGDDMVCIIDDREDVWSHATNLIHVKPYHFFRHTGDINAPPGLEKDESDNKEGIDLTDINEMRKLKDHFNEKKINGHAKEDEEIKRTLVIDLETTPNEETKKEVITNGSNTTKIQEKGEESDKSIVEEEESEKSVIEGEDDYEKSLVTQEELKDVNEKSPVTEAELKEVKTDDGIKNDEEKKENKGDCKKDEEKMEEEKCKNEEPVVLEKQLKESPKTDETDLSSPNPQVEDKDEEMIEIEDADDYLIYLEEILLLIHRTFYEEFDKMEAGEVPDLKTVIPKVRSQVLKGNKLVFSGLVPTHIKLEQSKAYQVARSLGAEVTQDFEDDTTHLVAVRPGTAKVNAGRRRKNLKIVTPDWLWCCAERWELVEERIFPLNNRGSKNRHPPPHCSSPEHLPVYPEHNTPALRKRTPSGRFMDTINPLMSFSSADIADMDKEVEDILDDESDSSDEDRAKKALTARILKDKANEEISSSSSSSEDSLTGEYPKGFKRKREEEPEESKIFEDINTTEDESPSIKFRRGEQLESDLDLEGSQDSEGSMEPPDEVDDGEWNMMGAALEREFLSND